MKSPFLHSPHAGRWLGFAVGIMAGFSPVTAKAQVGLNPMVIHEEVSQGQAQSVLTVTNPSEQAIRIRVYAQPFTYGRETGFTTLSEDSHDLTPYLQFSPREFVVPPGQRQRVRVVGLLPPSLLEAEYRAVIFTEALPENNIVGSNTAGIQTRIGSTVYFRQSDTDPELTVVNSMWNEESQRVELLVSNVGEATARPNLQWTLKRSGETIAAGESGSTTIIAENERLFQLAMDEESQPGLIAGEYEITGQLIWRFGTEQHSQPFASVFSVR